MRDGCIKEGLLIWNHSKRAAWKGGTGNERDRRALEGVVKARLGAERRNEFFRRRGTLFFGGRALAAWQYISTSRTAPPTPPLTPVRTPLHTAVSLYALCTARTRLLRISASPPCRSAAKHPPSWSCGRVSFFLSSGSSIPHVRDADVAKGTDQTQGRGQILSNIEACLAVQSTIKGTLGPYGGDLLMVDENGRQTITNDGATVMKVNTYTISKRCNMHY